MILWTTSWTCLSVEGKARLHGGAVTYPSQLPLPDIVSGHRHVVIERKEELLREEWCAYTCMPEYLLLELREDIQCPA